MLVEVAEDDYENKHHCHNPEAPLIARCPELFCQRHSYNQALVSMLAKISMVETQHIQLSVNHFTDSDIKL